jgi:hypothetical protein
MKAGLNGVATLAAFPVLYGPGVEFQATGQAEFAGQEAQAQVHVAGRNFEHVADLLGRLAYDEQSENFTFPEGEFVGSAQKSLSQMRLTK